MNADLENLNTTYFRPRPRFICVHNTTKFDIGANLITCFSIPTTRVYMLISQEILYSPLSNDDNKALRYLCDLVNF